MKILKYVLIALVLLVGIYFAICATMSSDFSVEREVTIKASSADIHPWVSDLKMWPEWTQWSHNEGDEPVITYGEKTAGVGAHQAWTAPVSGSGELTLTASSPDKGIEYTMFFLDGENKSEPAKCAMNYAAAGEGETKVTWTMSGTGIPLVQRPLMALVFQGMIEKDFDSGLARLKEKIEAGKSKAVENSEAK